MDQDSAPWIFFTPDEEKHLVVGEGRFANNQEQGSAASGGAAYMKNLKVYQFARSAETIRESYNFNITAADFAQANGPTGFWANADFWTQEKLNGTYIKEATITSAQIKSLSAENIQTAILEAKLEVGGEAKVIIDGPNSRIVIKD